VTDESDALKIAEFEHVAAGPSVTLLRVAGRVPPGVQQPQPRPALMAEHPAGLDRFDPLPSPPDPAGVVRAAYSVPATMIAPATTFRLELASGSLIELPDPVPGVARQQTPVADERVRHLAAENERLSSTLAELETWRGELERRLTETTDQLADARARLSAAELETLSLRAQAEASQQAARELAQASGAGPTPL
jgi:hypothetical protein